VNAQLWVTLGLAVFQGVLVPMIVGILRDHRRQTLELTARLEKLDGRLRELDQRLPIQYVMKDDYIRSIVGFERTLGEIQSAVCSISNNLQIHIGLGPSAPAAQKGAA